MTNNEVVDAINGLIERSDVVIDKETSNEIDKFLNIMRQTEQLEIGNYTVLRIPGTNYFFTFRTEFGPTAFLMVGSREGCVKLATDRANNTIEKKVIEETMEDIVSDIDDEMDKKETYTFKVVSEVSIDPESIDITVNAVPKHNKMEPKVSAKNKKLKGGFSISLPR